jgi:hypothetical protein
MRKKLLLIIIPTALAAGWFYWFQIRPSLIKSECSKKTIDVIKKMTSGDWIEVSDKYYSICLHEHGL